MRNTKGALKMKNVLIILVVSCGLLLGQTTPIQTWTHSSGDPVSVLNANDGFSMPIYMETVHVIRDAGNPNVYHTNVFNTNGSMMYQRTDVTSNGVHHRSFQYFGNDLKPVQVILPNPYKTGDNDEKDTFNLIQH